MHCNDRCWEKSLNSIAAFGLVNGHANGKGQGKDDGCRPVGYLDRAFGPPGERFLHVVNQSVIFVGLGNPAPTPIVCVGPSVNSCRRKGMGFFGAVRQTCICSGALELHGVIGADHLQSRQLQGFIKRSIE